MIPGHGREVMLLGLVDIVLTFKSHEGTQGKVRYHGLCPEVNITCKKYIEFQEGVPHDHNLKNCACHW